MAEPFKIHFMEKKTKPEQSKVVTPSSEEQHIFPDEGYAISDVLVEAIPYPEPEGTIPISITSNGITTHDVSDYANVEIAVNVNPFESDTWIRVREESIYVGENTISNGEELTQYFQAAQSIPETHYSVYTCKKNRSMQITSFCIMNMGLPRRIDGKTAR